MDIITQGLIGATVAQTVAKPNEARCATFVGFCAPLLADADALIRSTTDPLLFLEYHRHFSHALIFIPFGALLASVLLWPFIKHRLGFKRIYLYAILGYATSGFLDTCTSYGTHLLWPFTDERMAWNIIAIFDPAFSFGLIIALVVCLFKGSPLSARIGLTFAACYLMIGVIQHNRAEALAQATAKERGHSIERLIVKPTIANLLLWRSVYQSEGNFHIDALRVGLLNNKQVFNGGSIPVFNIHQDLPEGIHNTTLHNDIKRFDFFSDGFLVSHPEHPNALGDIRYAMLPTSNSPLWGIEFSLSTPAEHVRFQTYRNMPSEARQAFFDMLFNQPGLAK